MDHVVAGAPLISIAESMTCTTATEDADVEDDDDNFFVATFHDAPFDEQVYSERHALRASGCYKRATLCRASAPSVRDIRHTALVHEEKDFGHLIGEEHPVFVW